jgi:hypothetical protein
MECGTARRGGHRKLPGGLQVIWPPRGTEQAGGFAPVRRSSPGCASGFAPRPGRAVAAVGAGRIRHRDCALFHRRSRAGSWRRRHRGDCALRGCLSVAAAQILCCRGDDSGRRRGPCHCDLKDRAPRAHSDRKIAHSVSLSGFVQTRDIRERTDRFVLRVATMDSPRDQIQLERVRLSVRKGTAPGVGSFVELKARLQPPLAPLRPGSYDFSRDLFFQGIGASGFVMGAIKTIAPPVSGGLALRYAAFVQRACAMRSTPASTPDLTAMSARSPPRCSPGGATRSSCP